MNGSGERPADPARKIFQEALKLSSLERDAFITKACGRNTSLRANVDAMLQHYVQDTGDLQHLFIAPIRGINTGPKTGTRIGAYRLEEELGRGGMGVVYRGTRDDGELQMTVAVKLIKSGNAAPEFLARFRKERQLLANLRHPHIAQLLDGGSTKDGMPYLIMEYVDGISINRWCRDQPFDQLSYLRLFRKLMKAVAFAHRKGVIHRDIKPANVLVTKEGEPTLLDFGIAHTVERVDGTLTQTGKQIMTPAYAAPEQKLGASATPRFDIYALGLLLMEILTGIKPRLESDPFERLSDLALEDVTAGAEGDSPLLSNALVNYLLKCLAKDPEQRFATCEEMLAELDQLLVLFKEPKIPRHKRNIPHWDILILASNEDAPKAQELFGGLQQRGLRVSLAAVPGDNERVVGGIMTAETCIPCLGPNAQAPWEEQLIGEALARCVRTNGLRVVPLLLPGSRRPDRESQLPFYLRRQIWLVFPHGDNQYDGFTEQMKTGNPTRSLQTEIQTCPFRGLEVFREEDALFFFGREAVTQRLEEHVLTHHFLAVLGPSGSGKSSVVQAGLLPDLHKQGICSALIKPGSRPLEELAIALSEFLLEKGSPNTEQFFRRLAQDERALFFILRELMNQTAGPRRVCLVIDQFEEIFTLGTKQEEIGAFLANVLSAVEHLKGAFLVVLTLRSDFLGKCVDWPNLNQYVYEHMIQMEPMDERALTKAIIEPARMAGLSFEPNLADVIINDVIGAAGELPLLEHALLELYERRNGKRLTAKAYAEIGGISGALAQRAEHEYLRLEEPQRQVLRKMFTLCLVHPGEGLQDTRRRATRLELEAMSDTPGQVDDLLSRWTEARLLTASRDEIRDRELFDVAHEALINKWDRIKTWMAEDRETARLLGQLRGFTTAWEEAGRHDDFLLRGGQLDQMVKLAELESRHLGDAETTYIERGLAAGEREKRMEDRRRNLMNASLIGALVIVISFAIFLFRSAEKEKNLRLEAEKATKEAEKTALLAESARQLANYNLALAHDANVGIALDKGEPVKAWLGALLALALEIPPGKNLPESQGRFLDYRLGEVERLLWTSPILPRITGVAVDPRRQLGALVGDDALIRIIDLIEGKQRRLLAGDHQITRMAFSPDGTRLAAGSRHEEVYLWDVENDRPLVIDERLSGSVSALAFSPNGDLLVFGSDGGTLLLWSTSGKDPVRHQLDWGINDLIFDPSGRLILATEQGILAMGVADKTPSPLPLTGFKGEANRLCWRQQGLVSGWNNGAVVFHGENGFVQGKQHHQGPVLALASSADGSRVFSSGKTKSFDWSGGKGRIKATALPGLANLVSLAFYGKRVIAVQDPDRLIGWTLEKDMEIPLAFGHRDKVSALAFTPDGRLLASGDSEGVIGLWPSGRREEPRFYKAHAKVVWDLAFSSNGSWFVSASGDHLIKLWRVDQQSPDLEFRGHTDQVFGVAVSPDDSMLASASADHTIRLWSLGEDGSARVLRGHTKAVHGIAFSSDGQWIASASADKTVRLWNPSTGEAGPKLQGHSTGVECVVFSPDNGFLASASDDQTIRLWTLSGVAGPVLKGHDGKITDLAYSPDGSRIASGSLDHTVRLWRVKDGTSTVVARGSSFYAVEFSPDGARLATGEFDPSVKLWNMGKIHSGAVLQGHTHAVLGAAFTSDGTWLASSSYDKTVRLWNMTSGRPGPILKGHSAPVLGIAVSPDDTRLASASGDRTVRLWTCPEGVSGPVLEGHADAVNNVAFSPDGRWLASSSRDQTVRLWSMPKGLPGPVLKGHKDDVIDLVFSPDGTLLASSSRDHTLRLWSTSDWSPGPVLQGHSSHVHGIAVSPDGSRLASASRDHTVRLWSTTSGTVESVLRGHSNAVMGVVFSPNGRRLISTSVDRSARIWDLDNGQTIAVLQGHKGDINWSPAISPDGRFLATPSDDRTIRLWPLDRLLLPPSNQNPQSFYNDILERSLYILSYRREGFNLVPQPRMQLYSQSPGKKTDDHLDHPRPAQIPLIQWLTLGAGVKD